MQYERPDKKLRYSVDLTPGLDERLIDFMLSFEKDQRPAAAKIIRDALDKYLPKKKKTKE